MAELRQNTWKLDQWYDQAVAGNVQYEIAKYLWVWGDNTDGQLGQNTSATDRSSPVQIPGIAWSKLGSTSSSYQTCYGIKSDGTMWTWGDNLYGLLGLNESAPALRSSPTQIPGTTWKQAYGGRNLVLASKTDGTLWNWGSNPEGGLGQNDRTQFSSPKQIGTDTTWVGTYAMIGCGEGSQAAIKTDGTLWTWGQNYRGELGLNQGGGTHISSPTQIPGTTWRDVKMGGRYCMATKTDGTLWIWGTNYKGVLANNDDGDGNGRSSPVQIPGTTWSKCGGISYSGYAAWAQKNDGTLWSWGAAAYGALGLNSSNVDRSSPTQIPGTTWEELAASIVGGAGEPLVFATKTDGTLWSWGVNQGDWKGGLGLNDIVNRSSPTQIGTDTDWLPEAGEFTAASGWGAALKKS